jgi:2-polyprenyl-3-methyl-5-hydroxy-6-metoxy-1,4-benzoquinol methylase
METVVCDICQQDYSRLIYTVQDTNYGCPGTFKLVECLNCGLVYQNPRPAPTEIDAYYPVEQYHPFRALREGETAVPAPLHLQRAKQLTAKTKPGRVLDVGCGSGLFLVAMQQQGWQGSGVEPNEAAARFGREELVLEVQIGDIFSVDSSQPFDLITFWDVLEHTHSPRAVLNQAYKLLKPTGYLALNVPNWGSLERRLFREKWIALDAPRHLYHFTPATLNNLLSSCGFTPENMTASAPPLSLSSNILRWLGDTFLRKGTAKALSPNPTKDLSFRPMPPSRRYLIALVQQAMKIPNTLANLINMGSGITIISCKS